MKYSQHHEQMIKVSRRFNEVLLRASVAANDSMFSKKTRRVFDENKTISAEYVKAEETFLKAVTIADKIDIKMLNIISRHPAEMSELVSYMSSLGVGLDTGTINAMRDQYNLHELPKTEEPEEISEGDDAEDE